MLEIYSIDHFTRELCVPNRSLSSETTAPKVKQMLLRSKLWATIPSLSKESLPCNTCRNYCKLGTHLSLWWIAQETLLEWFQKTSLSFLYKTTTGSMSSNSTLSKEANYQDFSVAQVPLTSNLSKTWALVLINMMTGSRRRHPYKPLKRRDRYLFKMNLQKISLTTQLWRILCCRSHSLCNREPIISRMPCPKKSKSEKRLCSSLPASVTMPRFQSLKMNYLTTISTLTFTQMTESTVRWKTSARGMPTGWLMCAPTWLRLPTWLRQQIDSRRLSTCLGTCICAC